MGGGNRVTLHGTWFGKSAAIEDELVPAGRVGGFEGAEEKVESSYDQEGWCYWFTSYAEYQANSSLKAAVVVQTFLL